MNALCHCRFTCKDYIFSEEFCPQLRNIQLVNRFTMVPKYFYFFPFLSRFAYNSVHIAWSKLFKSSDRII